MIGSPTVTVFRSAAASICTAPARAGAAGVSSGCGTPAPPAPAGFATVTGVKMSPDLRQAKVFVSVLGSEQDREASLEAIRHAAPHLRSTLGREVRLKFLPMLEIVEDTTAAYGERIETLLREAGVSKAPEVEEPEGHA